MCEPGTSEELVFLQIVGEIRVSGSHISGSGVPGSDDAFGGQIQLRIHYLPPTTNSARPLRLLRDDSC